MITSNNNTDTFVQAKAVRFDKKMLIITLSDEREVSLPMDQMDWLKWLEQATPAQPAKWTIEPGDSQFIGMSWMMELKSSTC